MFPLFTNLALLGGLAAVAAPILIHLLMRRKSQRMRFSSIQFFMKRDEQAMRKRKLRNLLLLAARVSLFVLIVLAFARPYLPGLGGGAGGQRQQMILVLDASASMQATGPGGAGWARAKEMARQALAGLGANDQAALVSASAIVTNVSGFAPPSVVAQKLAELPPSFGAGEITAGLQQALKLAKVSGSSGPVSICVISDLQRNGCENLASVPLPPDVTLKTLDLGERFAPNVAVTELRVDRESKTAPHAVISSFSDEHYSALKLQFKMDGEEVYTQSIALAAGAVTNVPLSIPALKPGWHSAELSIQSQDSLAADDTRHATLFVPERIHGLVVETRKTDRSYLEETFFVGAALDPAHGTTAASPSRFSYEKATLENLAQKLQPQPGQPKVEFVVLPGVRHVPGAAAAALTAYVQAGGGLMLFLGPEVSAARCNTELAALLPARLDRLQTRGESEAKWRIAEFNKSSPLFSLFSDPRRGNLRLPEFSGRFHLIPHPGSTVAASFDDGMPCVVERPAGQGRVVLVNSSADTAWTDWQKHKTFVPWLHAAGHFAAGSRVSEAMGMSLSHASGEETELDLGLKKQTLKWQRAGGKEMTLATDDLGLLRDVAFDAPGIYSLRDAAGKELKRLAANLPAVESDLALLAPDDFEQRIARAAEPSSRTASLLGDASRGQELWRLLLLGALILMLIEPFAANRTVA